MSSLPDIEVLLEDGPCLVVNKPAGLLTEGPPAVADTLVERVKAYLKQKHNKPGNVYLGIPHRLDRAVSGAIVFAKNSKAARRLAEQFRDKQVKKTYWALVHPAPPAEEGTLRHWLRKDPQQPLAQVVEPETPAAREALLHYQVLQRHADCCLLDVTLLTGRFHQIRIQLAAIGCPVLGDTLYGSHTPFASDVAVPDHSEPPIALHARRLTFLHPIRYEPVTCEAPAPAYWESVLQR